MKEIHIHKSDCINRKASYTLEAVVVIPFTVAFWCAVLFFFQVLQVETGVQEALFYAGRITAVEACATDSDAALLVSAEVLFRKELNNYPVIGKMVSGGSLGISLLDSDLSDDTLKLTAAYTVKLPFSFFPNAGIRIQQNSSNHKWIGKTVAGSTGDGDSSDEQTVYVTDYGSVYHCSDSCTHLKLSIQSTSEEHVHSLRNSSGAIYYPCSGCNASAVSGGTVYYTNYGTNYHSSLTCSGLKRTTRAVKLSEVEGIKPCSKCGGG